MATLYGRVKKRNKAYSKINWKNDPDTSTPLSATNLGETDEAIDTIDNRVIVLDTTKANQSDLLLCVKTVTYNTTTGIIALTWQNGSTLNIDLPIEKIPVSFSMDENGVITMTNADGTSYTADIGNLIKTYNFVDSDQIDFTATLQEDGSYNVTGSIKGGSITDAMLESGYLASVTAQASSASTSSQNATAKATLAESYAKGGTNTRAGEDTDNAKYYSDRASALVDVDIATTSKAGIVKPDGTTITVDANGLINAPGGHTHSNKATLDSITETNLINWNAKADTVNITKSGTSIYLNDSKVETIVGIKTYGKSIQNGTPTVKTPIQIVDTVNPKIIVNRKNLLKNTATSQTINGVTFTVNADKSVTVNGTASAKAVFYILADNETVRSNLLNKELILTGCPEGGSQNTFRIQTYNVNTGLFIIETGLGKTFTFNNASSSYNITIQIQSGTLCDNLLFKPMIRLASITDATYEPYTEQSVTVSGTFRSVGDVKDIIDSVSGKITRKIGNIASYNGETITTAYISSTGALTTGANINYVLPTPTEETIDTTTLTALRALTTYYPITNISSDKSCDMKVTYKSTSSVGLATSDSAGTVKPDGTTITVGANGVITATAQSPGIATPLVAGIVKFDDETIGMDENHALYVIGGGQASSVAYSNTTSGLTATNVQDAIDDISNSLNNKTLLATSYPTVENNPVETLSDSLANYRKVKVILYLGDNRYGSEIIDLNEITYGQVAAIITKSAEERVYSIFFQLRFDSATTYDLNGYSKFGWKATTKVMIYGIK